MTLIGRKFLHASDLHIGAPLGKLENCPTLDDVSLGELTRRMQRSFDNLVALAIDENVVFVVLSGDIYDGAEAQDSQQGLFQRGLERLDEAGIPVFIALGNHDPKRAGFSPRKPYPGSVTIFDVDTPHEVIAAQDDDITIRVAGVSFGANAVRENLAARFSQLPTVSNELRVGVLHTSLSGNSDHETYAPCSVDDLARAPVDYWALGHIHLRSVSSIGNGRWYCYPGNLQGRSFKPAECHPKGVLLVPIERDGFGEPEFVECDTVRFLDLKVDISSCDRLDQTYQMVCDTVTNASESVGGRQVIARISLIGRTPLHGEASRIVASGTYLERLLDSFAADMGSSVVAGVSCATSPDIDLDAVRQGDSLLATSLRTLDEMSNEELSDHMQALVGTAFVDQLDLTEEGLADFRRRVVTSLIDSMATQ